MFDSLFNDIPESLIKSLTMDDGMESIIDNKILQEDCFGILLEGNDGFLLLESGE